MRASFVDRPPNERPRAWAAASRANIVPKSTIGRAIAIRNAMPRVRRSFLHRPLGLGGAGGSVVPGGVSVMIKHILDPREDPGIIVHGSRFEQ
jgi:hypothetical protein